MIRSFIAANVRLSLALHNRLPWRFKRDFFSFYYELVADHVTREKPAVALDAGCGRRTDFMELLPSSPTYFIGLDFDFEELRHNRDIAHLLVADATKTLPIADGTIDILTTRSVLEHLADSEQFFRESCRVLSPGGTAIHIFPGRNAPFALLNRLLSNRMANRLLSWFYPEIEGGWGYPAFYDNCSYRSVRAALKRSGFEIEGIHCRFYQATYYRAFLPAYLLFLTYDLMLWMLRAKRLSSQLIVIARKKGP